MTNHNGDVGKMSDFNKYTIEPHGGAHVLYQGRNSGNHGLNLVTLTEKAFNCDFNNLEELLNKGLGHAALVAQVELMKEALTSISDMCIGEIAMNYKLDAQYIGELIYKATGMTNPELHEDLKGVD